LIVLKGMKDLEEGAAFRGDVQQCTEEGELGLGGRGILSITRSSSCVSLASF
jgi:hypothetical protein